MTERWMRDSATALKAAIGKFKSGNEGDFKQALIIADHAAETIMRNYLIFIKNSEPPFDYPSLLRQVGKSVNIAPDIVETVMTFRLLRDGFHHHRLKNIEKGLKGTTTGLTLERSYIEDYLGAICTLFKEITGVEIYMRGETNGETH